MTSLRILAGLVVTSVSLSGCAAYSDFINSFGPDRKVSELRSGVETPLIIIKCPSPSPLCNLPTETYMVMPEDGKVGTVAVTFSDGRQEVLQGDYSAMTLRGDSQQAFTGDADKVKELFGDAVAALPPAPYHAKLYFINDKDELTPDSKVRAKEVYDEILRRENAEITVVGHTDTAASATYNDALSLRRAMKVRQNLIDLGVSPEIIETQGAGEHQLLVQTPDGTPEPKNRRVEINVR